MNYDVLEAIKNAAIIGNDYVEVTEGMNGYPKHLQAAISCSDEQRFPDFDSIEKLCKEINNYIDEHEKELTDEDGYLPSHVWPVILHRRDGWQLWEHNGSALYQFDMSEIMCEKYDYLYTSCPDADDFLQEIKGTVEGMESPQDVFERVDWLKKLWNELEIIGDDEIIYGDMLGEIETCDRYTNSYNYDTHNYIIAIM